VKNKNNFKCFSVSSLKQSLRIFKICKIKDINPIFFIDFYIIDRFGIDWLIEYRSLLKEQIKKNQFKIYVNCNKNYGLFISLVKHNFDYLKIKGDKETLFRLKDIANKNKITVNPKFDMIESEKI
tara:strand:- start:1140 stop:1514 length:375 start_codon:yes stop_codon:yes gene_type:complete